MFDLEAIATLFSFIRIIVISQAQTFLEYTYYKSGRKPVEFKMSTLGKVGSMDQLYLR